MHNNYDISVWCGSMILQLQLQRKFVWQIAIKLSILHHIWLCREMHSWIKTLKAMVHSEK